MSIVYNVVFFPVGHFDFPPIAGESLGKLLRFKYIIHLGAMFWGFLVFCCCCWGITRGKSVVGFILRRGFETAFIKLLR